MSKSRPSNPPTKGDWDKHSHVIKGLYKDHTLKEVIAIMINHHGFKATERMYKARLGTWNVPKYRKGGRNKSTSPIQPSRSKVQERAVSVPNDNLADVLQTDPDVKQSSVGIGLPLFPSQVQRLIAPAPDADNVESIVFQVRQYSDSHFPTVVPAPDDAPIEITATTRSALNVMLWQKIYKGLALLEQGARQHAFATFESACQLVRRVLLNQPRLILRTIFMVFGTARWDRFEGVWYELIRFLTAMAITVLGFNHPISRVLVDLRKPNALRESAELSLRSLLVILEERLGLVHPETLRTRRNLSVVLRRQTDLERSEQSMLLTISICEKWLGSTHVETVRCLRHLANLYMHHSRYKDAERLLVDALGRAGHPPDPSGPSRGRVIDADTDTLVYATRDLALIAMQQNAMDKCRFRLEEFSWICWTKLKVQVETFLPPAQNASVTGAPDVPTPLTMVAAEGFIKDLVMSYDLHCDELASRLMSMAREEKRTQTPSVTPAHTTGEPALSSDIS